MNIDFTLNNLRLFAGTRSSGTFVGGAPAANPPPSDAERLQVQLTRQRVSTLQDALSNINDILQSTRGTSEPRHAEVESQASLNLDNSVLAARRSSTDEVNATPTSFSPFGPDIDGLSTAEVSIEGVYNGENGDDTLRFKVRSGGVHGLDTLKIRVFNGANQTIKNITIKPEDAPDKTYNIGNGLKLTLGTGLLVKNDQFYVDVSASTGSAVDPDKAFDGTRNDQPNLQYGDSVGAGTFDVNGYEIDVYADDTINTVLGRINGSAAGVTATFNAATEKIDLVHNLPGADGEILLENDTSGFLAATKLSGSVTTPGKDADVDTALEDVTPLQGVTTGSLIVNGTEVAIDASLDSLRDIVARINAESVGLTATLIDDDQRVRIASDDPGADLSLDDGGTGFFAAIGIEPGLYQGVLDGSGMSSRRATLLADEVAAAVGAINDLGNDARLPAAPDGLLRNLRNGLRGAAADSATADPNDETRAGAVGLSFALDAFDGAIGDAVSLDRDGFRTIARERPEAIQDFFLGSTREPGAGYLGRLRNALAGYVKGMADQFGAVGSLLDVFV